VPWSNRAGGDGLFIDFVHVIDEQMIVTGLEPFGENAPKSGNSSQSIRKHRHTETRQLPPSEHRSPALGE
jgi:hypothetical protein